MARSLALALVSGVPALVYEVLWTRQVALLVGGQVQAVAVVLVAFFGGLALGSRVWGGRADRHPSPLRLYAALEAGSALLALAAFRGLAALSGWGGASGAVGLALGACTILPASFLLGGTLPALLRAAAPPPADSARAAGLLVGANTAGAVLGVVAAALGAPTAGLVVTFHAAGLTALGIAGVAWWLAGPRQVSPRPATAASDSGGAPVGAPLLGAAAVAGAATLAFEVLATRAAALRLGSSLAAWALVLALFLMALAAGSALAAGRAARSPSPARTLGWIEAAAGSLVALGALALVPDPTEPAHGLTARSAAAVALALFPPAALMGAAFPFFVRLATQGRTDLAARFGAVSAANTAGGIAGSLAAPFWLLPALGLRGGFAMCAAAGACLAVALFATAPGGNWRRWGRAAVAALAVFAATAPLGRSPGGSAAPGRLLFVDHGPQASAAVVRTGGRRDLYVDGDAEASTGGAARATEEWLALLPLWLHAEPRRLLEVGLGSGITLGTAARFPLESLGCFEIARSVLRAAPYFAPQNGGVADGDDPRIRIERVDGRAALLREPPHWDAVLANTLHPWSVGATGLYSRQYYERVRRALAPGGLAVQWLPLELAEDGFAAIVRTFFEVFPHGGVWWGERNVLLVGAEGPLAPPSDERFEALRASAGDALARLGVASAADLRMRQLADAETARAAVGAGEILTDDRPSLELRAARRRAGALPMGGWRVAERMAAENARRGRGGGALLLFIEAGAARARGDTERADRREALAEAAGLSLARRERLARATGLAAEAFGQGRLEEAQSGFRGVLAEDPQQAEARFGLAAALYRAGELGAARTQAERLVADHPDQAEGWNLLGVLRARAGEFRTARADFERALEADPWYPEALASAAELAEKDGDVEAAAALRARLAAPSD